MCLMDQSLSKKSIIVVVEKLIYIFGDWVFFRVAKASKFGILRLYYCAGMIGLQWELKVIFFC